jgi:cytochrome c551/c552
MPLTRRLAPAAILALTAVSAHAQDGDVAADYAFARGACNACHVVEAEQQKPRRITIGPAFLDVANTRDDRDRPAGLPHDVASEDAEPDPYARRDRGRY